MGKEVSATPKVRRRAPEKEKIREDLSRAWSQAVDNVKAQLACMSEEQQSEIGKYSDNVAFVAPICDIQRTAQRVINHKSVCAKKLVGYAFQARVNLEVPVYPLIEDAQDGCDVVKTHKEFRKVAKGQIFYLNVWEAAMFISQPEYGGRFTGRFTETEEVKEVLLAISKNASGIRPQLRAAHGTIKDNPMYYNKQLSSGRVVVSEGFEAFENLIKKPDAKKTKKAQAAVRRDILNSMSTAITLRLYLEGKLNDDEALSDAIADIKAHKHQVKEVRTEKALTEEEMGTPIDINDALDIKAALFPSEDTEVPELAGYMTSEDFEPIAKRGRKRK